MKLFSKIKDERGSRVRLFGLTVYELRKTPEMNITYLLGIKVRSKRPKGIIDTKALADAERNIRHVAETARHLRPEEKHILCFDCLYDPLAEAVDAWTLFEYLQTQGIPSRYALLKTNPLYAQLEQQNKLKDILPVDNEFDLLQRYPEEIARSKRIYFSFPFTCSSILRDLPNCPFIFIEHGVNLMKPWCVRLYAEGGDSECNYILTPSRPTKTLYDSLHLMQGKCSAVAFPAGTNCLSIRSTSPNGTFSFSLPGVPLSFTTSVCLASTQKGFLTSFHSFRNSLRTNRTSRFTSGFIMRCYYTTHSAFSTVSGMRESSRPMRYHP